MDPDGRGGPGAADRLCQRSQSAAGARVGSRARNRHPHGHRRRPASPCPAVTHRKRHSGYRRRNSGPVAGAMGAARAHQHQCGQFPPPRGRAHGWLGARFHHGDLDRHRDAVRPGAGFPDFRRHSRVAQGRRARLERRTSVPGLAARAGRSGNCAIAGPAHGLGVALEKFRAPHGSRPRVPPRWRADHAHVTARCQISASGANPRLLS